MKTIEKMQYITDPRKVIQTKHYDLLCMIYITILLIVVVLCSYMAEIKGFIFNIGAAVVPLLYFIESIIVEVYGYSKSRQLVWKALLCEAIFVALILMLIKLPSPSSWHLSNEYRDVLSSSYKILTVNVLLFPFGEFVNIIVLSKCKILLRGKLFWLRCGTSSIMGELILAIFGNIIVFGNQVPFLTLLQIMKASFLIKVFFSIFAILPIIFVANWLKKSEGLDIYDYNISFNPFTLDQNYHHDLKVT